MTGMETYANRGGDSNVTHFAIGPDSITVRFRDGAEYLCTYSTPGRSDVERMKELARQGTGLNEFISRTVKKRYERKLK